MKIAKKILEWKRRGYALLLTVVFIAIALSLLAGLMAWTSGGTSQVDRNNLFRASTGAAEAASSLTIAYMWRDFYNQSFSSTNSYTDYLPDQSAWPVQFAFSDGSGTQNQSGVTSGPANWTTNWQSLNAFGAPYSGLSAFVAQCAVTSKAMTKNQAYDVSATVQQKFDLAAIPIFQFAVFYNLNMEIDPGAAMTISGPVFSNDGIWARGLATYGSSVSAVGTVSTGSGDPYVTGKTDNTASTFNGSVTTNMDSLTLPLGTTNGAAGTRALLGLPPSGTPPYSEAGQEYFANEANIIISNSADGNMTAFFQDPTVNPPLALIPNNHTNLTPNGTFGGYTTYTTNYDYTFATNVQFYDYREGKTVQAVQLDVNKLNLWLSNSSGGLGLNNKMNVDSGHHINSVYVYNNAQSSSSSLPAVRVANGAVLPSDGLTVVTPDPLYVMGNYNANAANNSTGPAALIGDAITVLSGNWSDSYNFGTKTSARLASNTTINAATLEGIVQSTGGNYSGGVENFLRLLEDWGDNKNVLTYNGSIVVMFPSQFATNHWSGSYYSIPKRNWSFDVSFMTQKGLPPITPQVRAIIRQNWAVY